MKLTGELKEKADQTQNLEEAKDVITKAGMLLTDDEVSEVAGGTSVNGIPEMIESPTFVVSTNGHRVIRKAGNQYDTLQKLNEEAMGDSPRLDIRPVINAEGIHSQARKEEVER